MIRPSRGRTRTTRPRAPRSLPWITWTSSSFLMLTPGTSEHLRRQRDDPHEPLLPQLAGHGTEDPGSPRLPLVVDQHHRVLVELDVRAVRAPLLLGGPHDHCPDDAGPELPLPSRLRHEAAPSSAASRRSVSSVMIRAMSCRTALIIMGLSSWPVASWKRRLNSSSFEASRRAARSSSDRSRNSAARLDASKEEL